MPPRPGRGERTRASGAGALRRCRPPGGIHHRAGRRL